MGWENQDRMPGERRTSPWIEVDCFPFTPQTAHFFSPKSCIFQTLFSPGPPVASWIGLRESFPGYEGAQGCSKGLAAWALASFLSCWQKAEGKKIHSNTRARGHLRREIRLLLGEAQMESRSWEKDLFACCPHSPLGSSVTVSSVLIILSRWSTRLAWQRIESRRSFSPAEMYCVCGLFVGDVVVGGGGFIWGLGPSGSSCPAKIIGISLQCLPTHGEEVRRENCAHHCPCMAISLPRGSSIFPCKVMEGGLVPF